MWAQDLGAAFLASAPKRRKPEGSMRDHISRRFKAHVTLRPQLTWLMITVVSLVPAKGRTLQGERKTLHRVENQQTYERSTKQKMTCVEEDMTG